MLPKTYVIACDELPERKEQCRRHLEHINLPFTFWRAFHGRTFGLETRLEYDAGKRISSGHVALNLSHWALWNHLAHTMGPGEVAMVCEDDVSFPTNWKEEFTNLEGELEKDFPDWEFVFVGAAETEPKVWHKVTERVGGPDSRLCRIHDIFGTHCYWVRASALPTLIDGMRECRRNMDQQLYQNILRGNFVKWCAVIPTLVEQRTYDHRGIGQTEWAPSCIDPPDTPPILSLPPPPPPPPPVPDEKPTPAVYEKTLQLTDPHPCIYRGESLPILGRSHRRAVPLLQCAFFDGPCHTREFPVSFEGRTVRSCKGCDKRTAVDVVTGRSRLPLPDGHFNPSLALWKGQLVLATRDSWGHSRVALWKLSNAKHDWTGTWDARPIGSYASAHKDAPRLEDPRLFVAPHPETGKDHLHAMFNLPDGYPPKVVRVGYCRFAHDLGGVEDTFIFESPTGGRYEKNWTPFFAKGKLRWVYGIKPRHVVMDADGTHQTWNPFPWAGGAARGGACPVLVRSDPYHDGRDVYYSFFHGCLKKTRGNVYTCGVYTFEPEPPFRVLKQTPTPLLWPDQAGPEETVIKRMVLWAGGAVKHCGYWHIALGIDDTYSRITSVPCPAVWEALKDVPEEVAAESIRETAICNGFAVYEDEEARA